VRNCFEEIGTVPITVSYEACDRVKEGLGTRIDIVYSCCLVFSSDENDLPTSINSLSELDIMYASRVLQRIQNCQFLRLLRMDKRKEWVIPYCRIDVDIFMVLHNQH
jgi:hypothetical protein